MTTEYTFRPHDFPDLYSTIFLDGLQSPGVVTLSGHDREQEPDDQVSEYF